MDEVPRRDVEALAEAVRGVAPGADWLARAACLDMDPSVFFPRRGDEATARRAMEACAACPVWRECLAQGLRSPDRGGIRAATTERTRRALRRLLGGRSGAPPGSGDAAQADSIEAGGQVHPPAVG